ncbi:MAG: hypothetical protein KDD53_10335, partial [Bdellovibrionales bacterium]|nr:hypothetical protein [Bdellovibrionales bacterium]
LLTRASQAIFNSTQKLNRLNPEERADFVRVIEDNLLRIAEVANILGVSRIQPIALATYRACQELR